MGAADDDANALSTVAANPSATTDLPGLDKAAVLPIELVLNIMDHAIHHAESTDFLEISWRMERDDSQELGVSIDISKVHWNLAQALLRRFKGIRTLLQTNRKIRSMVLGKFYFLYPPAQEAEGFFNYILINPKKDQFQFAYHCLWDAIGHPRAALKPLVERISKVFIGGSRFFTPSNSENIEILKSLPSLRRVDIDIESNGYLDLYSEAGLVELEVGSDKWRIHEGLFPDLAEWADHNKSTFPTIWQPFKEKGVRLLGWRIEQDWAENVWTATKEVWLNTSADGIYMKICEGSDYYDCN